MVSSRNTTKIGSCKKLEGSIYVLSVFVSVNGCVWDNNSAQQCYNLLFQAEDWLTRQARRYGKAITFENGGFGSDGSVYANRYVNLSVTKSGDLYQYFDEIMQAIGYRDKAQFYDWAKNQKGADNSLILFFFNTDDRSFAYCATSGMMNYDPHKYNSEYAVIYRAMSGHMTEAGTIAHEILHLFGAWDMYPSETLTKEQSDTAARMYPRSIMIQTQNIEQREIDEVNAWLVGLGPEKDYFRWFQSATAYGKEYEVDSEFDEDEIRSPQEDDEECYYDEESGEEGNYEEEGEYEEEGDCEEEEDEEDLEDFECFSATIGGPDSGQCSYISICDEDVYSDEDEDDLENVEIVFTGKKFISADEADNEIVCENGNSAEIETIEKGERYAFGTSTGYYGYIVIEDGKMGKSSSELEVTIYYTESDEEEE